MLARLVLAFAAFLALGSNAAQAQPSMTQPGDPNSYPHTLALPPLPIATGSPFTSLPPPTAEEPAPEPSLGVGRPLHRPGFSAIIQSDGRIIFDSRFLATGLSSDPTVGPRIWGSFDLTDLFGRDDPYAWEKLALLEETFEQRAEVSKQHRKTLRERSIAALPQYLKAVWTQEDWNPSIRRRLLFALWDECAEGSAPNAEAGAQARYLIEEFIAMHLPAGGPDGYTIEEVRAFNAARTSAEEFAPR